MLKLCERGKCSTHYFKTREVTWLELRGVLIALGEPGQRLVGGEAWGYQVWGSEGVSILVGNGRYPVVALEEEPSDVLKVGREISIAFGGKALKPWAPVSVVVRGAINAPVRRGVLVALP